MQVGSMERRTCWQASCLEFQSRERTLMPTSLLLLDSTSYRVENCRTRTRVSGKLSSLSLLTPLSHRHCGWSARPGCGASTAALNCTAHQRRRSQRWRARSDDFVCDRFPQRVHGVMRHVWDEEVTIISLSAFVPFSRMFPNFVHMYGPSLENFDS